MLVYMLSIYIVSQVSMLVFQRVIAVVFQFVFSAQSFGSADTSRDVFSFSLRLIVIIMGTQWMSPLLPAEILQTS